MSNLADFIPTETKPETCEKHGVYQSRIVCKLPKTDIWSKCPVCETERQAVEQREADDYAAKERQRIWHKRLGEAGIPERFHNRMLDNYIAATEGQQKALKFAQTYASGFDSARETGRSAIFCGKPGTGKTHLAVGIGLQAMERGNLVLFTTVQRMVRRVKDSWRSGSDESESDVIRLLVEPDLLILDEIGVQFGTDFERNLLFDVLNERYEKRRPALLLSNLTATEVRQFLGERVYDRLREDGGACVPFDWKSYRAGNE